MRRIIFDTEDIVKEFLTRADMKDLSFWQIQSVLPVIRKDAYKLVMYVKIIYGPPNRKVKVYLAEWYEDGRKDSDEWVRNPNNFLSAFAEGYIREAIRLEGI